MRWLVAGFSPKALSSILQGLCWALRLSQNTEVNFLWTAGTFILPWLSHHNFIIKIRSTMEVEEWLWNRGPLFELQSLLVSLFYMVSCTCILIGRVNVIAAGPTKSRFGQSSYSILVIPGKICSSYYFIWSIFRKYLIQSSGFILDTFINPSRVFAVHGYAAFKWSYLWFAVRVYTRLQAQFRNAINMEKTVLEIHRLHYCVAKGVSDFI
jgi:hypothetical protein